jgi:hypothetical protein
MAGFLTRDTKNASLENHYADLSIGLEEEMLLVNEANDDIAAAEEEVEQVEAAENVVVAADQTADLIEKNNGEVDEAGVIAVDNLMTAANNISSDDGVNNPGDPLNESDTEKLIPVVESSGKFYVSIESFRETFAKIKKKILEIVASIWARIKAAYRKYFGAYTSLMKRAKDIETRADNMSGKIIDSAHKTFEISSGVQFLSLGNTEPTTNTAGGHDAVLHLIQTLRVDHKAEAMQDGAQGHVRVGGPLPCPQGIGQYLVGDALPAPQNEILHQRRCLAGLRQLCQHGLAVHTDLKAAQHFDFNCCHPSHPRCSDAHDVPAFLSGTQVFMF